jgi:PAS domain S-box-containing protein
MAGRESQLAGSTVFDAMFAHAPVGLGFWDLELRFRQINPALATIKGMPEDACLGRTVSDVLGDRGAELEGILRQVLATGEPVLDVVVRAAAGGAREWIGSYYPVADRGGMVGVAGIVREVTDQRAVEAEQQRLLKEALMARAQAEAAQAGAEEAQREAEAARARTAFIAEVGARMATSLDPGESLRQLARAAVPGVADWCTVVMAAPDGSLDTAVVAHADPAQEALVGEMAASRPLHVDDTSDAAEVIRSGRAILREEITDEELEQAARSPEHLALLRQLGARSAVTVPLKAPGGRIGTISFVYGRSGRRYEQQDLAMARALAARASLHIENARLYTERSHIARTLQAGLLPAELPEIPGVEVAVRYRAAGDQNEVGGDFYDVYETGEGRWNAVVGDVSGKGAEAAALTALTRHTLYAGALRDGEGVANLLLLNEAMLRRTEGAGSFCTVVTATIAPRPDGAVAVHLANGGHPAPVILRAGGEVEQTTARGSLVGALNQPRFAAEDLVLRHGDVLLLFTDGVTELRTSDPTAGERRLRATLAAHVGRPAAEIVEAVERDVVEASHGEPRDDIALLALRPAP